MENGKWRVDGLESQEWRVESGLCIMETGGELSVDCGERTLNPKPRVGSGMSSSFVALIMSRLTHVSFANYPSRVDFRARGCYQVFSQLYEGFLQLGVPSGGPTTILLLGKNLEAGAFFDGLDLAKLCILNPNPKP